jgi:predicted component of type VI protein secretion system
MAMTALIVEIVDSTNGKRSEFMFSRSPIRIGRSPLNDLPLDHSFVSHCHGLIQFDKVQCQFTDLGSTNGTFVGDRRLTPNEPVPLGYGAGVLIGSLTLSARHSTVHAEDARGTYAFRRDELLAESPRKAPSVGPTDVSGVRSAAHPSEAAFMEAVRRALPGVLQPGMEQRFVEKLVEALQRFTEAFLELRQGQHQLARDLNLPEARSEFGSGHNAMELLSLVVDPRTPGSPLDELSRAHADLMLHQIALINAARAGARAVLAELSPDAIVPAPRGPMAWLGRLLGRDVRWEALRCRYEELGEETALSSVLFGKAFRRAYAATLGQADGPSLPPIGDKP